MSLTPSVARRVAAYVDRSAGPDACWPWTRSRSASGYGAVWAEGRMEQAHRVVWALEHGEIPSGLLVLHRCDNPPCCNPTHLFLGTAADNSRDMAAKGRQIMQARPDRRPRGERNGRCRLTDVEVDALRAAWERGERNQAALARRFGIGRTQVRRLINKEQRA